MRNRRFTFLSLCVTALLAVVLAACGKQTQPEATSELPSNFGQAEVMLPGFKEPQKVTYEIVDGKAYFEGDIILGKVDAEGKLIQPESQIESQGVATNEGCFVLGLFDCHWRWPGGVIPFVINSSVTANGRTNIMSAIAHWESKTAIRFVPRTTQGGFIEFTAGKFPDACASELGWNGRGQYIELMSNGDCPRGTLIHEIGHAVGLHHEQGRADRDSHVTILLANIENGWADQFQKYGNAFDIGSYDFNSIMHYSAFAFCNRIDPNQGFFRANCVAQQPTIVTIPAGIPIGQQSGLSAGDRAAVRAIYTPVVVRPVVVRRSTGFAFNPNETWTDIQYFGSRDTFFADVTGDGKADAIVVNDDRITVRHSTGSEFSDNESWTTNPYFGTRGTFFADVTGDGKADAIAVNDDGVAVRPSTGSDFSLVNQRNWTSFVGYYGTRGTFFADVTGDGRADAIAVNDDGIAVRPSTGSDFSLNNQRNWTNFVGYYGTRGTFFADVSGDGKGDAIVVNDNGVVVRTSDGSAFVNQQNWTGFAAYYGTRGTYFADVTGDGKADAIVVNDNGVTVRRSTGSSFSSGYESWTLNPYYGSKGTFFADVTGDRKADAIVANQ